MRVNNKILKNGLEGRMEEIGYTLTGIEDPIKYGKNEGGIRDI